MIAFARIIAVTAALGGAAAAAWAVHRPLLAGGPGVPAASRSQAAPTAAGAAIPDSLMERLVIRTPFRAARRPSAIAYDPALPPGAEPPSRQPAEPPSFVVTGVVLGSEPAAVLEGVPGVDGPRLARRRDSIAGFRVVRIGRDGVVLAGPDTTWRLPVRTTW